MYNIKVTWKDGEESTIDADMFGDSEAITDFIAVVLDKDELKCLINKDCIKMISFEEVVEKAIIDTTNEGC
jgi:hypothetical protein